MTFEDLIAIGLRLSGGVGVILAVMHIIGSNSYDLRAIKQKRQYLSQPHARRYKRRPLISVIVITRDDERVIETCLASLVRSSYRKFEIIVADNASQDKTRSKVTEFIAQHPNRQIRLFAKRLPASQVVTAAAAYHKYAKGELVMLLDAGSTVDKQALTRAVMHFNSQPDIGVLSPKASVEAGFNGIGLLQRYQELLGYRSRKFNSVSNSAYEISGPALYRRQTLATGLKAASGIGLSRTNDGISLPILKLGNKASPYHYAADVVVHRQPQASFYKLCKHYYQLQAGRLQSLKAQRGLFFSRDVGYTKFLTWFRLPFAVCVGITGLFIPLLMSYFVYLALSLHEPTLLFVSWAILGILLVLAIWDDEQMRFRQKIIYSLGVPVTYGAFYILSFMQIAATLRSVVGLKPGK